MDGLLNVGTGGQVSGVAGGDSERVQAGKGGETGALALMRVMAICNGNANEPELARKL